MQVHANAPGRYKTFNYILYELLPTTTTVVVIRGSIRRVNMFSIFNYWQTYWPPITSAYSGMIGIDFLAPRVYMSVSVTVGTRMIVRHVTCRWHVTDVIGTENELL